MARFIEVTGSVARSSGKHYVNLDHVAFAGPDAKGSVLYMAATVGGGAGSSLVEMRLQISYDDLRDLIASRDP